MTNVPHISVLFATRGVNDHHKQLQYQTANLSHVQRQRRAADTATAALQQS
jgi:hypothetical protein